MSNIIPQNIQEQIDKYRTEGPIALARILESEHNRDSWSKPMTFEEFMEEDERDYQQWLAEQQK